MTGRLIELENVSLRRQAVTILDRLSLQIELGQHTVVLGPNGAGKTSFLKLLMRFFYPSVVAENSGRVSILGREQWNVWELRQRLGYINSEIDFHFSHGRSGRLTAYETVLTGFSATELEVDEQRLDPAMHAAAEAALSDREVAHLRNRSVAHLSTGERRRVLLARALVHRPQALILDEPTTGLDIGARHQLLMQLQRVAEGGTTLVLVTHHIEEVVPAICRAILLQSGRAVFQGSRQEAFTAERLSQLFGVAIALDHHPNGWLSGRLASHGV